MWPQYKDWIYHCESPVQARVEESNLWHPTADIGVSTKDVGGNMHAMLCDMFGVHDAREDNYEPQPRVQGGEEHIMDDEPDTGAAQKYDDLIKKADKPLHGKTRYSKLSATIHLYNLKCMGGVTNTMFWLSSSSLISSCLMMGRLCQLIHMRPKNS